MVSQLAKDAVQVVVIDTGFLFPETYLFAHALTEQLGIQLLKVRSERTFAEQMTQHGNFLFASDIDACCHLNKVEPMRALLNPRDVWISGIRADQSKVRAEKARLKRMTQECFATIPCSSGPPRMSTTMSKPTISHGIRWKTMVTKHRVRSVHPKMECPRFARAGRPVGGKR